MARSEISAGRPMSRASMRRWRWRRRRPGRAGGRADQRKGRGLRAGRRAERTHRQRRPERPGVLAEVADALLLPSPLEGRGKEHLRRGRDIANSNFKQPIPRHSGTRAVSASTRVFDALWRADPESISTAPGLSIPGSRFARPGMTRRRAPSPLFFAAPGTPYSTPPRRGRSFPPSKGEGMEHRAAHQSFRLAALLSPGTRAPLGAPWRRRYGVGPRFRRPIRPAFGP